MSKLNLLPRGYFEISLEDSVIKGRFCTWSMQRFCDRVQVLPLSDMLKILTENLSIPVIAQFLLAGVEYCTRDEKFTQEDAYEWMDELGGISGSDLTRLIQSAISGNDEAMSEEKKTLTTDL